MHSSGSDIVVLIYSERETKRCTSLPNQADQAAPERLLQARPSTRRAICASSQALRWITTQTEAWTASAAHACGTDSPSPGSGDRIDSAARVGTLVGAATNVARSQIPADVLYLLCRFYGTDAI